MKNTNKRKILLKTTLKYIPLYLISIIFLVINKYFDSYISLFVGQVISILSNGEDVLPQFIVKFINYQSTYKAIVSLAIILLIIGAIQVISRFISYTSRTIFESRLLEKVSISFYENSIKLPASYLSSISTGNLIQRCIEDTKTYADFYNKYFYNIFESLVQTGVYLVQIYVLSKMIFFFGLISVILVLAFALLFGYFYLRKREKKASELASKLDSMGQQSFTNINLVKSFANEQEEERKFNEVNKQKEELSYKLESTYQIYWFSIDNYYSLFKFGAYLLIGYNFIKGKIDIGLATTLMLLSGRLLDRVPNLLNSLSKIIKFSVATSRLQEYLKVDNEYANNGTLTPCLEGDIIFNNVTKKYNDKVALDNINLHIKQNQTIGIIGKSGSGKSTLVNLLSRLFEYEEGSITINGTELKDIDKRYLRENISFVNQTAFLFAKTVKENITILEKNVDYEPYVKKVDLDKDIKDFEEGYDTLVGERGVTLSGGQKQRLSIVRSLLKNKRILVLDDSLSAVDNNISKEIRKSLKDINATTIIISHNLMNVMDADNIIVLDKGKIIEQGNHKNLLKQKGQYAKIWSLQQKLEEVSNNE